jgi:hypothetical protein
VSLQPLLSQLSEQTHQWIELQRSVHWQRARPLSASERASMADFYSAPLLASVRVRPRQPIENPPFYWRALDALQKMGIQTKFSLTGAAGITFVDCIVLPQADFPADLLFHELVHVVQYRVLGTRAFAERYVNGLASAGFDYEKNPMEAVAFELQERFCLGARFDVERIVESGLGKPASA